MTTTDNPKSRTPKYALFANQVRQQIETGELKTGDQLPSFAQMLARYGIGQSTVERMYSLLEQEGLVIREPNRGIFVAVPKRRGKTGAIGLLIGSDGFLSHPYYVRLLSAIQSAAHNEHTEIVLLHENSRISPDKMDGLLLCQGQVDRMLQRVPAGLPAISLVHRSKMTPSVVADETDGIRAAVQHLLDLGHRRIAYLSCGVQSWMNTSAKQRMAAYQDTLKAAGIKPLNRWCRPVFRPFDTTQSFEETGYARTKQWLDEDWRQLGFTALLAHNDDVAIGAIDAFQAAGMRVPDDVSVVGFDGTEISEKYRPRLTTVELPLGEIGARGVELLLARIAEEPATDCPRQTDAPETIVFPTRFHVRDSTATLPARDLLTATSE